MAISVIKRQLGSIYGTRLTGTLYTNNFRPVVAQTATMGTTTSIPNATAKRYCALTLSAGVYMGYCRVRWGNGTTGSRRTRITDSSGNLIHNWTQMEAAATNGECQQNLACTLVLSQQTTIYAEVYHSQGSALNVLGVYLYFRRLR